MIKQRGGKAYTVNLLGRSKYEKYPKRKYHEVWKSYLENLSAARPLFINHQDSIWTEESLTFLLFPLMNFFPSLLFSIPHTYQCLELMPFTCPFKKKKHLGWKHNKTIKLKKANLLQIWHINGIHIKLSKFWSTFKNYLQSPWWGRGDTYRKKKSSLTV